MLRNGNCSYETDRLLHKLLCQQVLYQGRCTDGTLQQQHKQSYGSGEWTALIKGGQMAERFGNRAINQMVAGSIPSRAKMTLCPWARHFTVLASGGMSLYLQ